MDHLLEDISSKILDPKIAQWLHKWKKKKDVSSTILESA